MLKKSLFLCFLALFVLSGVFAEGQKEESLEDYPSKPIKMLMGYSPGGGSDQLAQLVEPFLQEVLDCTFSNEYLPGASGAIAWTKLGLDTEPDGYTIGVTNTPSIVTNVFMQETIEYELEDFDPIANVVTDPGVIVVAEDSPYDNFEEFLEAAKDNPGEITCGNSGVGGDDFFTTLLFEDKADVDVKDVPFEGDGPSWQAAMGGKVDASFNNVGITFKQVEEGNLKALAVMSEERLDALPDVPTLKEKGFDVVSGSSRGVSAPAGLPPEIREKLIDAFKEISENEELLQKAEDQALNLDWQFGEDYKEYLESFEEFEPLWEEVKDNYQE